MSGKRAYSRALVFAVFAVFVVFAVHVTAAVASSVAPSFRLPRHSLPNHLEAGSHHFTSIQSAAKSESIFDRFWGTDCFSKALQEFSSECRGAYGNAELPTPSLLGCSLTPDRRLLVRQQICCPRKRHVLPFISCVVN